MLVTSYSMPAVILHATLIPQDEEARESKKEKWWLNLKPLEAALPAGYPQAAYVPADSGELPDEIHCRPPDLSPNLN